MARRRNAGDHADVELPITPMLDMAFQLLVFFIFTYHPSSMEMHIDGNLLPPQKPIVQGKEPSKSNEPAPSLKEKPPDTSEDMVVIVEAMTDKDLAGKDKKEREKLVGTPRRILIQKPDAAKPDLVCDRTDDLEQGKEKLAKQLQQILISNPNASETAIDIKSDGDLKHEYFISVYDICRTRYGVQNKGGKEVLTRIDGNHKEKDFAKVLGFQKVGFVAPEGLADDKNPAQ